MTIGCHGGIFSIVGRSYSVVVVHFTMSGERRGCGRRRRRLHARRGQRRWRNARRRQRRRRNARRRQGRWRDARRSQGRWRGFSHALRPCAWRHRLAVRVCARRRLQLGVVDAPAVRPHAPPPVEGEYVACVEVDSGRVPVDGSVGALHRLVSVLAAYVAPRQRPARAPQPVVLLHVNKREQNEHPGESARQEQ